MDHGIADLDPGRPAIDQDPPRLAFEGRQQAAGAVQIGLVQVQGGGQLAFQMLGHLADLLIVVACHHSEAAPNTSACSVGSARNACAVVTNN